MTIHEFGKENNDVLVMFHPLGVWWDVFEYVIPGLSEFFTLHPKEFCESICSLTKH